MAELVENLKKEDHEETPPTSHGEIETSENIISSTINIENPKVVQYCGVCSLPLEYCEFGSTVEECRAWAIEFCPDSLQGSVAAEIVEGEGEEGEGKRKKKGLGPKKKAALETRVVISLIQRQKKKFVTVVTGLETVPELKIKDAAKVFGKKFSSGSSVGDTPQGGKEVVIQGDVMLLLPQLLISEFKIHGSTIFYSNNGELSCYQ